MSSRGENKKQKSISAPKARHFSRKKKVWTIRSKPGPFSKNTSVPLGFLLRELTGISETMKEVKVVLNNGFAKVNGTVVKSRQFPVGLFDIVDVNETGKRFRVMYDKQARIVVQEMDPKEKLEKISRIVGKGIMKGGKMRFNTAEGYVLLEGKSDLNVGDSVMISLPEKKILSKMPMKKGNTAYIIGGKHVGEIAVVADIAEGTAHRPKLVELGKGDGNFKTLGKYVFMVGEKEAVIKI